MVTPCMEGEEGGGMEGLEDLWGNLKLTEETSRLRWEMVW